MDSDYMITAEEVLRHGNGFKLLAACFYEPERELLLEEQVCENLRAQLMPLAPAAASAAEDMKVGLREAEQEQLHVDYAALFVGPFELIAAPYGSVYLEKHRRVMGDTTIDVQRFYQAAGLTLEIQEPPDHIAIELEVMYYLCLKEVQALAEGVKDEASRYRVLQAAFFRDFMGWIPEFSRRIENGAETRFYQALANCLNAFYASCRTEYRTLGG